MTRTITVFATSDLHAHWLRGEHAGLARVAAHIRAARAGIRPASRDRGGTGGGGATGGAAGTGGGAGTGGAAPGADDATLWIDDGDTLSGSALGAFLAGRGADHPVLPFLEEQGLDVAVPGNHDLDHGVETLIRRAGALRRTAYVCANLERADGSPLFPASVVLDRGGVRIGVIGAVTGHLQRLTRYEAVAGVRVLAPVAAVAAEVARLRPIVDVLLVSYHGGFEADPATGRATQYDTGEDQGHRLLREVPGIDGLIAGHQHRVAAGVAGGVAYAQPGYAGEGVGVLRFVVDRGRVVERSAEVVVPAGGVVGDGPASAALARADADAQRWLDEQSGLDADAVHGIVAARTGVPRTALLLPAPTTRRALAAALPGPYGVERYRMPRAEAVTALAALPPGASTRGLSPDDLPEHVDLVASTSLRGVFPVGRVQDARPYDWLDELATAPRSGGPGA